MIKTSELSSKFLIINNLSLTIIDDDGLNLQHFQCFCMTDENDETHENTCHPKLS